MRLARTTTTAVVALTALTLTACGGESAEELAASASSSAASSSSAAASSSAEARRSAANAAASAAAASSSAAAAAAAASASAAAEAARRVPTVFTGSGDSVVAITKPPGSTVVIATVTGNKAGRYFGVKAVDGDQDTLANTTDPYNGTTLMDANRGGTTQLQVTGVGPWSITLSDLLMAPVLDRSYNGAGDAVLQYNGGRGIASITGNAEGRYFGVKVYGSGSGGGSLVNTTDPYTGSVPWLAGPTFVTVTAQGDWSINVS